LESLPQQHLFGQCFLNLSKTNLQIENETKPNRACADLDLTCLPYNGIFEWMHNAWSFIRDRLRAADIRTTRTKRNKEMKKTINTLLTKLSENSTWRGLILIATAIGVKIEPELQEAILVAGLGLVGLINIIRKG
jgi:hypothetical protein